ncbi:unnamed protein product [Paramecium pentaurelia]|uniref:EF-hand domain-containing protein n=1 Tax=Paramecium pentaurelia TaxID=43138 RepID=A0A8S1UAY2_9CILI|nr:unnamed protein product [Paramecium pentaurelia]
MEVLQKIIQQSGTNLSLIDLEFKQIENLQELLPFLIQFKNLKELNLHGNRLRNLPDDLSQLKSLETLDITNNMFENLQQVVQSLKTLPQLNHLEIALKSKEEEEFIIENLPQLQMLNQQAIKIEDHSEQQSDMQSERSVTGLEITLQQEDLEQMALLHDSIKELRKEDEESEKQISSIFENSIKTVMKELQTKLAQKASEHISNLTILKAKYNLYEVCFQLFLRYFKLTDRKLEQIITKLHDQHQQIFTDMSNIIMNVRDNQQIQLIDKKQLEINQGQLKQDKGTEQRLRQELQELQSYTREIEQENKSYLELLIKFGKGEKIQLNSIKKNSNHQVKAEFQNFDNSSQLIQQNNNNNDKEFALNLIKPQQSQYASIQNKINQQQSNVLVQAPQMVKTLTLKQFKDLILEIYESKLKFDQRCSDSHLPRETMEQHMYTFLNQKYGLKSLILEWVSCIINALKRYGNEDNDVAVFGKILRNECDEEFRFIQGQVKNTILELLKMYLRGKFPLKTNADIKEMMNQRVNSFIFQEEAEDIIKYMYNQEDSELILNKLKQYFIQQTKHVEKRMTREEQFQIVNEKDKSKIEFSIFQKFILDFQMKSHEKYLSTFIQHFKQQDQDQNGIIDENEFRQLITELNIGINDLDIQRYLNKIDPYNNQQITFSQCVQLFSQEQAPGTNVPIIQKILSENL